MMSCRYLYLATCIALHLTATAAAYADELHEDEALPAVQNRVFAVRHEFSGRIGILPVNAFYKGLIVGGGYAWHIDDMWAVEVDGVYSLNFHTSLRNQLENNFAVLPTKFAEMIWYGEAGGLFKPLYGKLAWLNNQQIHGEAFLSLHGVVAGMQGGDPTDDEPSGRGSRLAFGGAPGFGLRLYLTPDVSVRFDFRSMILYSSGQMHFPIAMSLGLSYSFGGGN